MRFYAFMFSLYQIRVGMILHFLLGVILVSFKDIDLFLLFFAATMVVALSYFYPRITSWSCFFLAGISGMVWFLGYEILFSENYSWAPPAPVFSALHDIFVVRLNRLFPQPESGFLAGLLLGDRAGLPYSLKQTFTEIGMSHVLAVSGYNISLVLLFCSFISVHFPRLFRIFFHLAMVMFFVFVIGFHASVVRASMMGIFAFIGLSHGRRQQSLWLLLLCAFLMTLINPRLLMFDIGFQLSFAATLGLIVIAPLLQKCIFSYGGLKLDGIEKSSCSLRFFVEIFSSTIAAQIATFPLVWWHFRNVQWIGIFANLIIVPFISFATVGGFISLMLSFVFGLTAARFLAWPEFALLRLVLWFVSFFAYFVHPD